MGATLTQAFAKVLENPMKHIRTHYACGASNVSGKQAAKYNIPLPLKCNVPI